MAIQFIVNLNSMYKYFLKSSYLKVTVHFVQTKNMIYIVLQREQRNIFSDIVKELVLPLLVIISHMKLLKLCNGIY